MEPEDKTDKASRQSFNSKLGYFKTKNKSEQSTQTKREEHVKEGQPQSKQASSQVTSTQTQISEIERSGSPRRNSPPPADKISPQGDRSGFSPNDMEVFQQPMCLVSTDEQNQLKIETEAAEQISKIDWPIVVVSVVGLYRTGKSYLMNRLAESSKGFALGSTIESQTKGIWVWCKIHSKQSNTVLLLLDTEGLGDVEKGDQNHDNKIFTLATLLCNCLVYNIKGAFDQDAVSKLTFVTQMAQHIQFRGTSLDKNSRSNLILPNFVLCLRDFCLELSYKGVELSENGYLDKCLEEKESKDEKFNAPRNCIRKYFPVRKCFAFPIPCGAAVLKNLDNQKFENLSDEFKETTTRFVSYINSCEPKTLLAGKPINGQMFATLATKYVTAFRQGGVPDVDDAFSAVTKLENDRVEMKALKIFETKMGTLTQPVPFKSLETSFTEAQETALAYHRENAVADIHGKYELQAQKKMDNFWKKLKEQNTENIQEMCENKLQELYQASAARKIEDKAYEVAGGHKIFLQDMDKLENDFTSYLRNFQEHEISRTWFGFKNKMKKDENRIIEADAAMSREIKEEKRKQRDESIKKMIVKQGEDMQKALKEQHKTMNEHNKKILKERMQQLQSEQNRMQELATMKLEKKKQKRNSKI